MKLLKHFSRFLFMAATVALAVGSGVVYYLKHPQNGPSVNPPVSGPSTPPVISTQPVVDLDKEAREKLAVIYAEHYQRLDMATLELNQLIDEPNQPPKRVAHWLNLLANLQFKCGADCDTVRGTLEQIVERFPGLPVAEIAQSRLARLNLEFKGKEETPGKKLGVYEQNVGLKYGSPYRSPRQL